MNEGFSFSIERFSEAHAIFLNYIRSRSRIEFQDFEHPYFCQEEINYKHEVLNKGQKALLLSKWQEWSDRPGKILEACRKACEPDISKNLLEHRYGKLGGSSKALYRVKADDEIEGLEAALFDFIGEYPLPRTGFGAKCDQFAEYLRSSSLGCNWAFVCYLAFLADPKHFFPIRPGRLDVLLAFFESSTKLSGKVEWSRYKTLLELTDWLAERLSIYGEPSRIRVQSYMWILSSLLEEPDLPIPRLPVTVSYEDELRRRIELASRRERTGLKGEHEVLKYQKELLYKHGLSELAEQVRLVSAENSLCGYDILSFGLDGSELHIEVKTTTKPREIDIGFYISANEVSVAKKDVVWHLYRVRDIDTVPEIEDLGNPFTEEGIRVTLLPTGYFVGFGRED